MKAIFVGLAVSSFALAAPAMAQDESTAGGKFVAGAIVGVDSFGINFDGFTGSDEDVMFGLTAGYDIETASGLVFGVEAEYTDSSLGILTVSEVEGAGGSLNAGRDLYVGGRLGFRPGKNGLLYVKAGYTNASIEFEFDDYSEFSPETNFDGFRIGAGGEIDLGSNYAIRLEYRYSDYGSPALFGFDNGLNVSRNQGILTLLGKF